MPAFDQAHEVCEILEKIAPNVNELQLFMDDVPDMCMGRESPFILPVVSILFYITPFRGRRLLPPFTLRYLSSPLHLSPVRSSFPWSLGPGDVGLRACRSSGSTIFDPR